MKKADNWIAGRWQASASGNYAESTNPANGESLGTFADSVHEDASAAISAARAEFDLGVWAQSPRLRAKVLLEFADALEGQLDQIAELLTLEHGKPSPIATLCWRANRWVLRESSCPGTRQSFC